MPSPLTLAAILVMMVRSVAEPNKKQERDLVSYDGVKDGYRGVGRGMAIGRRWDLRSPRSSSLILRLMFSMISLTDVRSRLSLRVRAKKEKTTEAVSREDPTKSERGYEDSPRPQQPFHKPQIRSMRLRKRPIIQEHHLLTRLQ